jgi:ParB-like chromosome segregation protein Spo0J
MPTISTTNVQKKQIDMFGGMDKLIEAAKADKASDFELVPLDQIMPNPYQIRAVIFEDVVELAYDIYANGMLQVPVGRKTADGTVQQAFGHRRKLALDLIVAHGEDGDEEFANWQNFTSMKLIIKPLTDMEMYLYMASENGQRENPNIIEVARSIQLGKEQFKMTAMDAAKPHGITSSGNISNMLSLLTLPLTVQALIEGGAFGVGKNAGQRHGIELVRLVKEGFEKEDILKMAQQAIKQDLTVGALKLQVDHEIKERNLKMLKVTRHCPHCGEGAEFSEWQIKNEGALYQKCAKCGDKSHKLAAWFMPERQAEKEKILAEAAVAKAEAKAVIGGGGGGGSGSRSGGGGGGGGSRSGDGGETATWLANRQTQLEALQAQTTPCPHCGEPMLDECKKCGQTSFIKPEPTAIPTPTAVVRWCPQCDQRQEFIADFGHPRKCGCCGVVIDWNLWLTAEPQDEVPPMAEAKFAQNTEQTPGQTVEADFTPGPAAKPDIDADIDGWLDELGLKEAKPTTKPEVDAVDASTEPEPEGAVTMVQLEEVKKDGRKVKMFIRKNNNPAVDELAERLWGCLSDDDTVNMAAIFDVLFEIGWKETMEAKFGEAIGDEVPPLMKARLIKKLLAAL